MAAAHSTIASMAGVVEVQKMGAPKGSHLIVAVACGGGRFINPLDKVSSPVLSMELRGYGGSKVASEGELTARDAELGPFQLSNYMADFDSVIKSTKSKRAVLFGYSHSGFFTTAYALAKPANVEALILMEPALFNDREELLHRAKLAEDGQNEASLEAMLRYVQPSIGMDADAAKKTAGIIMTNVNDKRTLARELLVRAENPIEPKDVSKLEMPVLLIGGTRSHVSHVVTTLARLLPYASLS